MLYELDLVISTLKPPPTSTVVKSLKSMVLVTMFPEPSMVRVEMSLLRVRAAATTTATAINEISTIVRVLKARVCALSCLGFLFDILRIFFSMGDFSIDWVDCNIRVWRDSEGARYIVLG